MILKNVVQKNSYYDSATLMLLSSKVGQHIGSTKQVAVMMGSDMNKDIMRASGLLGPEGEAANPNDLVFAIQAETEAVIEEALAMAQEILNSRSAKMEQQDTQVVKTVVDAAARLSDPKLAVVSLPGKYAVREVKKLLRENCHVLLFSDNISCEDENTLKDMALERDLLMMGPDCGTAVINGVGLGFANKLRRGNIGLAAASGTGLQEVMSLISNFGGGVSQALGTGGRDLKDVIGGKMMGHCIRLLQDDPDTQAIVVISKPPAPSVMENMLEQLKQSQKPTVVCFLGGDESMDAQGLYLVHTLEEAACKALELAGTGRPQELLADHYALADMADTLRDCLGSQQKYIRGLYCGGTLAYESMLLMGKALGDVHSNIALESRLLLDGTAPSVGHTVLDLGDDAFTVGKPHPMIEPSLRGERLLQEALDPATAVILLDVEIGYGSHENPASVVAEEISQAKAVLAEEGREVVFVASICGTYEDMQDYAAQKTLLEQQGVVVLESNAQAAELAILTVSR